MMNEECAKDGCQIKRNFLSSFCNKHTNEANGYIPQKSDSQIIKELTTERDELKSNVTTLTNCLNDVENVLKRVENIGDHKDDCTHLQHNISGYICSCGWDVLSEEVEDTLKSIRETLGEKE